MIKYCFVNIEETVNKDINIVDKEWKKSERIFNDGMRINEYSGLNIGLLQSFKKKKQKLVVLVDFMNYTDIIDSIHWVKNQIKEGNIGTHNIIPIWFSNYKGMKVICTNNANSNVK